MRVFVIDADDEKHGKYYCDTLQDVGVALKKLKSFKVSLVEMEEKDYYANPATNDSYELFSEDK